ncbi:MAG: O-antigen ligase family protein [Sphingobacteriales bacterium]|nr:O-antigen ligase family protein [Sphingobacteriales bacterium]
MHPLALKRFYSWSIFLLFVGFYLAYSEIYWSALGIPILFFGAALFLFSFDKIMLFIAFCTPLSLKVMFGNSGINLPDEPLMFILLMLFIIKSFENGMDKDFYKHPLTFAVIFNLFWILVTTLTSTMPFISFKFFLARLWCTVFGFFWGALLFKDFKKIKQFLFAFGLGLSILVFYSTIRHAKTGFTDDKVWAMMNPFMDDHTVYGAVCSIVATFGFVLAFYKRKTLYFYERIIAFYIGICALTGVVLSYSRAAWLSVIFALLFYLVLKLKISFRNLAIGLAVVVGIALIFNDEIYQNIRLNKASSGKSLQGDIKSISNVKTDESNVERLNRWESGWRMFQAKPLLGFGPGTYMFKYSPYQRAHEMTSISSTQGTMGGIHSEYFGPAVESGIVGLISLILLFGTFISINMKTYYQTKNQEIKMLSLAILLGLMTYFFHGLMNNFIDQDKAAVIFWLMMGMTVALSIRQKKELTKTA